MKKTLEVHYLDDGKTLGVHDIETGERLRIEVKDANRKLADKVWKLMVQHDHRNPNPLPAAPWPGSWEPQHPEDVGL